MELRKNPISNDAGFFLTSSPEEDKKKEEIHHQKNPSQAQQTSLSMASRNKEHEQHEKEKTESITNKESTKEEDAKKHLITSNAYNKKQEAIKTKEELFLLDRIKKLDIFLTPKNSKQIYSFPLITKSEDDDLKMKNYTMKYLKRKKDPKKMVNFRFNEGLILNKGFHQRTESKEEEQNNFLENKIYDNPSHEYSQEEMIYMFQDGFNKMGKCYKKSMGHEFENERKRIRYELLRRGGIRVMSKKNEYEMMIGNDGKSCNLGKEMPPSWSKSTKESFQNMIYKNLYRFSGDAVRKILLHEREPRFQDPGKK